MPKLPEAHVQKVLIKFNTFQKHLSHDTVPLKGFQQREIVVGSFVTFV